jgi:hypothetical protein
MPSITRLKPLWDTAWMAAWQRRRKVKLIWEHSDPLLAILFHFLNHFKVNFMYHVCWSMDWSNRTEWKETLYSLKPLATVGRCISVVGMKALIVWSWKRMHCRQNRMNFICFIKWLMREKHVKERESFTPSRVANACPRPMETPTSAVKITHTCRARNPPNALRLMNRR